jgi:hypothetical protein
MNVMTVHRTLLATAACWTAVAAAPASGYFTVPASLGDDTHLKPSTDVIAIPLKPGPEADATLIELGHRIEGVDRQLQKGAASGALSPAQLAALVEARNIAATHLADGKEVLARTSGGEFPEGKRNEVDSYLAQIMKGLASPAGRDLVKTNISFVAGGVDTALLYQSWASHANRSPNWSTYTAGQVFKVGTYVFKVVAVASQKTCEEAVPVLSDPTEQRVCGAFRP